MSQPESTTKQQVQQQLESLIRTFKETLAQKIWALPRIAEGEKEVLFKSCLLSLDRFETELAKFQDKMKTEKRVFEDENELLRSLMGVEEDDLRARVLNQGHDISTSKKEVAKLKEELEAIKEQLQSANSENEMLRKKVQESEERIERFKVGQIEERKGDIQFFWEQNEDLKNQLKDLETRMANMRELFSKTNETLVLEKQEEVSLLQKKLLAEMEAALKRKQELVWTEEALFAKGVANRVRNALVSAQGQLFFTLERLGLLDPETKSESSVLSRLKILMTSGGQEIRRDFRGLQAQFQKITQTLDDYLHLTGMHEIAQDPVDLTELVKKEMAEVYAARRPNLEIEFFPDENLPVITGDAQLLGFVVGVLFRNAVEALPNQSGKVVITTLDRSKEGFVELSIKDTGPGIPSYLIPKLFQPFVTTKPGRQGLNLSRAKKYVELHGGHIEMIQTGPDGTRFQVDIPIKPVSTFIPVDTKKLITEAYQKEDKQDG